MTVTHVYAGHSPRIITAPYVPAEGGPDWITNKLPSDGRYELLVTDDAGRRMRTTFPCRFSHIQRRWVSAYDSTPVPYLVRAFRHWRKKP